MTMAAEAKKGGGGKPDLATLGGLLLAVGGIIGGFLLEGGNVGKMLAPTAAMIVLGGTLGAVMITTPLPILIRAARWAPCFRKAQPGGR
jgi:chemotaxis protein MotA